MAVCVRKSAEWDRGWCFCKQKIEHWKLMFLIKHWNLMFWSFFLIKHWNFCWFSLKTLNFLVIKFKIDNFWMKIYLFVNEKFIKIDKINLIWNFSSIFINCLRMEWINTNNCMEDLNCVIFLYKIHKNL